MTQDQALAQWRRARREAYRAARALGRALAGLAALVLVCGVVGLVLAGWWHA